MAHYHRKQNYMMTSCNNLSLAHQSKKNFKDFANIALAGKEQQHGASFFVSLRSLKELVKSLVQEEMDGFQICLGMDENESIDLIMTSLQFLSGDKDNFTHNTGSIYWTRPPHEAGGVYPCQPGPVIC